ncbi:MAG: glycogen-debranching protein [Cellulosilyticum sp.]|nr:glycogen-debranching protein [Cellulosilyticum sp.]
MEDSEIMVKYEKLGCHISNEGACFTIYATQAYAMVLEVYKDAYQTTPLMKQIIERNQESHYFSVYVPCIKTGMYYVWRIMNEDYSYSPAIMDPYAKGVIYFQGEWRNLVVGEQQYMQLKPHIPWKETIIYELHVGHFTKIDESIPKEERGTFKGLIKKIPYLKELGVTTLEMLPIFKWYAHTLKNRSPYTGELLADIWGYNTLAFFALDERYSVEKTSEGSLREFKLFLEAAHRSGLEVILDVVYNHSGEGGEGGVMIHFKYLAPEVYYKYSEHGQYLNCSGTGNTLNTNHPIVKKLIKDSLIYWASEIGVDGFRFDLASILGQDEKGRWLRESLLNEIATDPILSKVKLITEGWDVKGSYDVGRMPAPFCEWSDYFRDTIRKFVKGDQGIVPSVSDCMLGKEIYFTDSRKGKDQTIHFIAAHDGFTMWDLVSYNQKHNEANGENNRDGHNANYSYNWGAEGDTEDANVIRARQKAMRNLLCLLFLSKGTPMLLMGDEFARTQKGNNNAFCQDNELVWVDWKKSIENEALLCFTRKLINYRKTLDYFKNEEAYTISWHGIHQKQPDLSYYSRSIACFIEGRESLFFIVNNYYEPLKFELPIISGKWECLINTAYFSEEKAEDIKSTFFEVEAYSVCLFRVVHEVMTKV